MNIQIVSDIHAEFWPNKQKFGFIIPTAPFLALLGDTCCCGSDKDFEIFKLFIMEVVVNYKKVFIITGNHEYYYDGKSPVEYKHTIQGINERISQFCKTDDRLCFLNNSSCLIAAGKNSYLIVGSTLWSWIPQEEHKRISNEMNDYKYTYIYDINSSNRIRRITPFDISTIHLKNCKYIRSQIKKAKDNNYKMIMLTHHKPYHSDNYNPKSISPAYESDLITLFKEPIIFWGYGHTHISDNKKIGETWLYSNPKGYPNQKTKFQRKQSVSF